jgi:hypothetical protein
MRANLFDEVNAAARRSEARAAIDAAREAVVDRVRANVDALNTPLQQMKVGVGDGAEGSTPACSFLSLQKQPCLPKQLPRLHSAVLPDASDM